MTGSWEPTLFESESRRIEKMLELLQSLIRSSDRGGTGLPRLEKTEHTSGGGTTGSRSSSSART